MSVWGGCGGGGVLVSCGCGGGYVNGPLWCGFLGMWVLGMDGKVGVVWVRDRGQASTDRQSTACMNAAVS